MVLFFQMMAVMIIAKIMAIVLVTMMVMVMMIKMMMTVMVVVTVMMMEGSGRVVRAQMWQKPKWAGRQQLISVRIEILLFDIPKLKKIETNKQAKLIIW